MLPEKNRNPFGLLNSSYSKTQNKVTIVVHWVSHNLSRLLTCSWVGDHTSSSGYRPYSFGGPPAQVGRRTKTFINITFIGTVKSIRNKTPTKVWRCRFNSSTLSLEYRVFRIVKMIDPEKTSLHTGGDEVPSGRPTETRPVNGRSRDKKGRHLNLSTCSSRTLKTRGTNN